MPKPHSEQDLIDQLRSNCEVTTAQFVRENISWMRTLATRIINDPSLADDCVQDAFISAFKGLEKFNGQSTLKTWLHIITVNASLMALRKRRRLAEYAVDEESSEFDNLGYRLEEPQYTPPSPAEIAERVSTREIVLEAVARLPDDYRNVILLRDIQEKSTWEVAAALRLSEVNVKVRLHRARKTLKTILTPLHRLGGI